MFAAFLEHISQTIATSHQGCRFLEQMVMKFVSKITKLFRELEAQELWVWQIGGHGGSTSARRRGRAPPHAEADAENRRYGRPRSPPVRLGDTTADRQNFGKCCSFSAVSTPIFASKY